MVGPVLPTTAQPDAFLDTIPEDQSVAQQRVANLSAASAVASSDSDNEVSPAWESAWNGTATGNKTQGEGEGNNKKKKHKRKSPASVSALSDAALVGGGESGQEQSLSQNSATSPPPSKPPMTKRKLVFYVVLVALFVCVTVGVGFIVASVTGALEVDEDESDSEDGISSSDDSPSGSATFPPGFIIELESEAPSPDPTLNSLDAAIIDTALLSVVSSDSVLQDASTPQGTCRNWLANTDQIVPQLEPQSGDRIRQRFILCVFFEATGGPTDWTDPSFLDETLNECEWVGVNCRSGDQVSWLFLPNLNIRGSIPDILSQLKALEGLTLETNNLVGSIPTELMDMENLVRLDLSANALTGTIPKGLAPLTFLDLGTNSLQGSVPLYTNMQNLRLQKNLFTDFDERYAELPSLQRWKMYDNLLEGELPAKWDGPNLQYIDLSENAWTGIIPSSMWNLPVLKTMVLHGGSLSGTLPTRTVSADWEYVWLYSNQLSGSIPPEMGAKWANLTELLLYDNLLTGVINQDHCDNWPLVTRLLTDCSRPTFSCTGSCCSPC